MKWWINKDIKRNFQPSIAERRIMKILEDSNIEYFREVSFEGLNSIKGFPLRFDFYIPKQNLLIEYDGYHHESKIVAENDLIKDEFALKNKIVLKRFNKKSWKVLEVRIWELVKNGIVRSIRKPKINKITSKKIRRRKKIRYARINGRIKPI